MFRTVKARLALVFGLYVSIILGLLGFSFFSYSRFNEHLSYVAETQYEGTAYLDRAARLTFETNQDAMSMLYALRMGSAVANELRMYIESNKRDEVSDSFKMFRDRIVWDNPEFLEGVEQFGRAWQEWNSAYDKLLLLSYGDESDLEQAEIMLFTGLVHAAHTEMLSRLDFLSLKIKGLLLIRTNVISGNLAVSSAVLASMTFVIVLLSVLQVMFFGFAIFRNVSKITVRLGQIAQGEGDLTLTLQVKNRDEFGRLAGNFNDFIGHLRESIVAVKRVSEKNALLRNDLAKGNDDVSNSVSGISGNLDNISGTMNSLHETVDQTESRIQLISDEIAHLDGDVDNQAAIVEQISASITEMIGSVNSIAEVSEKQKVASDELVVLGEDGHDKLDSTSEAIVSIKGSIGVIREMTDIIATIAEQTNLLAMNAAIEAAHAG